MENKNSQQETAPIGFTSIHSAYVASLPNYGNLGLSIPKFDKLDLSLSALDVLEGAKRLAVAHKATLLPQLSAIIEASAFGSQVALPQIGSMGKVGLFPFGDLPRILKGTTQPTINPAISAKVAALVASKRA